MRRLHHHDVPDVDGKLRGHILAQENPIRRLFAARIQVGQLARGDRFGNVGHRRFERHVDAFQADEGFVPGGRRHERFAENGGRGTFHVRDLPQLRNLRLVIGDTRSLEHEYVGCGAEDPIAQLSQQPCHQRERHHERHHPDHDAERRHQRDDGDERLPAPRQQIAESDVEFEGHDFGLLALGFRLWPSHA